MKEKIDQRSLHFQSVRKFVVPSCFDSLLFFSPYPGLFGGKVFTSWSDPQVFSLNTKSSGSVFLDPVRRPPLVPLCVLCCMCVCS